MVEPVARPRLRENSLRDERSYVSQNSATEVVLCSVRIVPHKTVRNCTFAHQLAMMPPELLAVATRTGGGDFRGCRKEHLGTLQ